MNGVHRPAEHVGVIGAGIVGLSCAWFLLERGISVTVYERRGVGAGASWGNAGWLSPALAVPLPEPATVRAGLRGFGSPQAPLYVPAVPGPTLIRFLLRLLRNSTSRRWRASLAALGPLNSRALAAHEAFADGGAEVVSTPMEPCLVGTRTEAQRAAIMAELDEVREAGQPVEYDVLTGDEARAQEPLLSGETQAALHLHQQRYIHPGRYLDALAAAVRERGGKIEEGAEVVRLQDGGDQVEVHTRGGIAVADRVVVATGALLNQLAREFGVRRLVQAGRGYSFSVQPEYMPASPVYFPAAKVVFSPLADRLRVAGMMEFRPTDAPLDPRRISSIVKAAAPFVRGIDWDSRQDEWVGARPCSADGLPLIGPTRSPLVYMAGGHGMWGLTHGAATGQLIAEAIETGVTPPELAAFNPLR